MDWLCPVPRWLSWSCSCSLAVYQSLLLSPTSAFIAGARWSVLPNHRYIAGIYYLGENRFGLTLEGWVTAAPAKISTFLTRSLLYSIHWGGGQSSFFPLPTSFFSLNSSYQLPLKLTTSGYTVSSKEQKKVTSAKNKIRITNGSRP